jgi:multicomponent Na+:H+ antiporter subunit E
VYLTLKANRTIEAQKRCAGGWHIRIAVKSTARQRKTRDRQEFRSPSVGGASANNSVGAAHCSARRIDGPCHCSRFRNLQCSGNIVAQREEKAGAMRIAAMAGFLLIFWLALSGHYTPWLVAIGLLSSAAVALAAHRAGTADREGFPIRLLLKAPAYWLWLVKEIALSAVSVVRVILSPRLPVTPTMTTVKAGQRTEAGIATYANSITLTPGTITVGVDGDELSVHALVGDGALDLESGRMDRKVTQFESRL